MTRKTTRLTPPKPPSREPYARPWKHIKLFRKDIFQSQPARLYRAWMAEFRLLFYKSYMVNDPKVISKVLRQRPDDFPKSEIVTAALYSLLGKSVFVPRWSAWAKRCTKTR